MQSILLISQALSRTNATFSMSPYPSTLVKWHQTESLNPSLGFGVSLNPSYLVQLPVLLLHSILGRSHIPSIPRDLYLQGGATAIAGTLKESHAALEKGI